MTEPPVHYPTGLWRVFRHGGRSVDSWRPMVETRTESVARRRYDMAANALRQGGVHLVDPSGTTIAFVWGARLRTRW